MEPIRNHPVSFIRKTSIKPKTAPTKNLFKEKIQLPEYEKSLKNVKRIKKGSRTTEDITEKKVSSLKRRTSEPHLQINKADTPSKAHTLLAKKSALWNCIDCQLDKYGGKLYFFEFKKALENEVKKDQVLKKIFPALELDSIDMNFIFHPTNQQRTNLENTNNDTAYIQNLSLLSEHRKELRQLGYDFKLNILVLPDRETLLARWAVLREKKPGLPPLDIVSSNGIASDLNFIESFFAHDAILSSDKEFVHDHTLHVLPILSLLLSISDKQSYYKAKFEIVKIISTEYRRLMIAKDELNKILPNLDKKTQEIEKNKLAQMETALGAFVDSSSASLNVIISKNGDLTNFNEGTFDILLSSLLKEWASPWQRYFEDRYGPIFNKSPNRVLRNSELGELRKLILKIEADFDKQRKTEHKDSK